MRTVTFQLSKHKKLACLVPEQWSELSDRQFLAMAGLANGWLREDEFFMQFFGISSDVLARIDAFQLYMLNELMQFLHQLEPIPTFPVKQIKARFPEGVISLYAPGEKLKGMTFQQFMSVDTYYTWYQHTKNTDFILSMVATLYQREGLDFRQLDLSEQMDAIRKVDVNTDDVLQALAMQWTLIRLWLSKTYTALFPGTADSGTNNAKKKPTSWLSIFDHLVEDDLTRLESYAVLPATDVLRVINRRIKDQQQKHHK